MKNQFVKYSFCIYLSFFCQFALASPFFCPNKYHYIDIGNTQKQVEQSCGKPTKTKTEEVPQVIEEPQEEWLYKGKTFSYTQDGEAAYYYGDEQIPKINTTENTLLLFTFKKGKVTSITLGSQEVGSTTWCDENTFIKRGDTIEKVEALCGEPANRNEGTSQRFGAIVTKQTWIYDFGQGMKVSLEFMGDKLTAIHKH